MVAVESLERHATLAENPSAHSGLNVLVVDDHPIFRQGLMIVISKIWPDFTLWEAGNNTQAREIVATQGKIGLILLDLKMPGVEGFDALTDLLEVAGNTPVVVVSSLESPASVREALDAGASGYILKSSSAEVLKHAISLVLAGECFVPSHALAGGARGSSTATHFDASPPARDTVGRLTPRQIEVLTLIAEGMSNKEIARALGMLESTVKVHVRAILHRLRVNNRTHAVITGAKLGIIPPTVAV